MPLFISPVTPETSRQEPIRLRSRCHERHSFYLRCSAAKAMCGPGSCRKQILRRGRSPRWCAPFELSLREINSHFNTGRSERRLVDYVGDPDPRSLHPLWKGWLQHSIKVPPSMEVRLHDPSALVPSAADCAAYKRHPRTWTSGNQNN